MEKIEKLKIWDYKLVLVIAGSILILFGSVYAFTRPAYWDCFNFEKTGSVGDTIGGITAPIMNLIGAILIYISFKAQINANKIQYHLLNKESLNQLRNREFQIALELFKELKDDFQNNSDGTNSGVRALNLYVNNIKSNWTFQQFENHSKKPILHTWKFIITEYDLILTHIENSIIKTDEKVKLLKLTYSYFEAMLAYPSKILKKNIEKFNIKTDIIDTLNRIDEVHKKYNFN
ncbi:hypothetical protein [Marinifilum fragile]|uniref:hypothetical protein n=1 Tax=Marinifilum fragile TaxID=570161 RepID=UPI002AA72A7C|nr:hypothetical protein [Marinifilum fragile]